MSVAARLWRTHSADDLAWRELDGEVVVYNAANGSTHLLDALAGDVLRVLVEDSPRISSLDIAARLRGASATEDISEWTAAVESVLTDFRRLGLAEPEQS